MRSGVQAVADRFYDPATGQFLTRDPLNALTRSAYGYVGGNPLNRVDPSGLDWSCITKPGSCDLPIPDSWEEALGSHTAQQVRAGAAVVGTIALVVAGGAYLAGAGASDCVVDGCAEDQAAIEAYEQWIQSLGEGGMEAEIKFTGHGLDQALGRDGHGVCDEAIRSVIESPLKTVVQEGGKVLYRGQDAVVVLNEDGQVVTTYATNHNGWRH
jgi:hypothetical protein